MTIHKTVLLGETIEAVNLKPAMVVVDATLGGGGHSKEVLKKISPGGKLIAFDQDPKAIAKFEETIKSQKVDFLSELVLINDNFSNLKDSLTSKGISSVDAIIADLGISSDQLDDPKRGISFRFNAPLDMRMNQTKQKNAAFVVNNYSENELALIFKKFGDEKFANKIAKEIVKRRNQKEFEETFELIEVIEKSIPEKFKHGKIHPATKVFQALRIEVNDELVSLEKFLNEAIEMLKPKGRLAVITFHSGEDLIAKRIFRENAKGCICPPEFPVCRCENKEKIKIVTKKPIIPSEEEISENPRSRSAKLRVIEKI